MTDDHLIRLRLANQRLTGSTLTAPDAVVRWLGAVQAQDYAGAAWALALRAPGLTDREVNRAFDSGAILRTHVLRPTWHVVTPADVRWLLALTAPRIRAAMAYYCRRQELDTAVLARSRRVLERALRDRTYLTRTEIASALACGGVRASRLRLGLLLMHAELAGLVVSGPRRGKQFTYALLDERAPAAAPVDHDEALAALVRRYVASRGPVTVRDGAWWSGLTSAQIARGLAALGSAVSSCRVGDRTYWLLSEQTPAPTARGAFLLPNYDEYLIAYKDRDLVAAPADGARAWRTVRGVVFTHQLVLAGRLAGGWRRETKGGRVLVRGRAYRALTAPERRALIRAAARYGQFLDAAVTWRI